MIRSSACLWTCREVVVRLPWDKGQLDFGEQHFDRNGAKEVHAWEGTKVRAPKEHKSALSRHELF